MNKIKSIFIMLLIFLMLLPLQVLAVATRFGSENYAVESVIIGATGVLRSSYASIPPIILNGPDVKNITTTEAEVYWTTDKKSNAVVYFGENSNDYIYQSGNFADISLASHIVKLRQLKKGTRYFYKIRSEDVSGNVVQSEEKTFVTDYGDVTPPKLLRSVTVAFTSATTIIVTWETDELSNSLVDFGSKKIDDQTVGRPEELVLFHQIQISGLSSQQKYMLRVKSRDASGNTYVGDQISIQTPLSPSITEVRISDITLNSAIVSWKTTVPNTSTINYGETSKYGVTAQNNLSYVTDHMMRLDGLKSGQVYYLRISGIDVEENRINSDEYVFKTVVLPTISNFRFSQITSNGALFEWDSSSDIDEVVKYKIIESENMELIGLEDSKGSDTLSSKHALLLNSLESSTLYQISVSGKDIFGNKAIAPSLEFKTGVDNDPPRLENVRTDTTVDLGSRQTVQVLVSFGLSEPGISYLEYGDGASGPYKNKVTTDTDFTRNKFMVIPELTPGNSYHFRIVVKDRAGNQLSSPDYLVLAPSQPVSLFDLIFGQVQKNFGWLSNVGK